MMQSKIECVRIAFGGRRGDSEGRRVGTAKSRNRDGGKRSSLWGVSLRREFLTLPVAKRKETREHMGPENCLHGAMGGHSRACASSKGSCATGRGTALAAEQGTTRQTRQHSG